MTNERIVKLQTGNDSPDRTIDEYEDTDLCPNGRYESAIAPGRIYRYSIIDTPQRARQPLMFTWVGPNNVHV